MTLTLDFSKLGSSHTKTGIGGLKDGLDSPKLLKVLRDGVQRLKDGLESIKLLKGLEG